MKCPDCGNNITLIEFSCSRCGLRLPVRNQEERLRAEKEAKYLAEQMRLEARMNLALQHRSDRVIMEDDARMTRRVITPADRALDSGTHNDASFTDSDLAQLREAAGESKLLRNTRTVTKPVEEIVPKRPSLRKATPGNNPFEGIDLRTGDPIVVPTPVITYADVDFEGSSFDEEDAAALADISDETPDTVPDGSALERLKAMARAAEAKFNDEQDRLDEKKNTDDAPLPKATTLLPDEPIPPEKRTGNPEKIIRSSRYIQPERPVNPLQALPTKFLKLPAKKEDREPIKLDPRHIMAITALAFIVVVIIGVIGVSLFNVTSQDGASASAQTTIDADITAAPDTPAETESVTAP